MKSGLKLCNQYDLDPKDVFRNQFMLTRDRDEGFEGLNHVQLGEWHLFLGQDMMACHTEIPMRGGMHVVVLGIAVDEDGHVLKSTNLKKLISKYKTLDALEHYLSYCAGRYVFFMLSKTVQRAYCDPNGMLGIVYNTMTGTVASSVHLALHGEFRINRKYPLGPEAARDKGPRFAFGHTSDSRIKRQLGNHYLDLRTQKEHRHWPPEDMSFEAPETEAETEAVLNRFTSRHMMVLKALLDEFSPSLLPLTGGRDSRLLLALAKPYLKQVTCSFTHINNWASAVDAVSGEMMAKAVGLDNYQILNVTEDGYEKIDDERLEKLQHAYRISTGKAPNSVLPKRGFLEVTECTPKGGILLRGHVTDILKAVLWDRGVFEYVEGMKRVSVYRGLANLKLDGGVKKYADYVKNPWFLKAYKKWYQTLPRNAKLRIYDFLPIEHFRPHGIGTAFYGWRRNFYLSPGNDRKIMQAAICLPPDVRTSTHFHNIIYENIAPELRDIPYYYELRNLGRDGREAKYPEYFPLKLRQSSVG